MWQDLPPGAGSAPPTAEGSGTAYDGQDYYDGWATSADLHSVRAELDSGHADIYQKIEAMDQRLEKIEALVLQLHRKFFPGGGGSPVSTTSTSGGNAATGGSCSRICRSSSTDGAMKCMYIVDFVVTMRK